MANDINVFEEIVKLNMRISCMESLFQHILETNTQLILPGPEEIDAIYTRAIQDVIDEIDRDETE
ncbi:MAG: hypothetical protein J5I59_07480 [Saprospiraceae bacterium]|nr:hypothetical protein [Saprospiraceae bacterium]